MRKRRAVIGIGSNLGSRESLVLAAADMLRADPEMGFERVSTVRETPPMGPPQPGYLNAAGLLHTALAADEILRRLLEIERSLGRERGERWGPRTLDLDLLWIDGESVATPTLVVPHPGLRERTFALGPLLELCPEALEAETEWDELPLARMGSFTEANHAADEAFAVRAPDRAELLAYSADALGALTVPPESVSAVATWEVRATSQGDAFEDDGERLHAWLSEVLYVLEVHRVALRRAVVTRDDAGCVEGFVVGERLDESQHPVRGAVKSVTWHALEVKRSGDDWTAFVVVDV